MKNPNSKRVDKIPPYLFAGIDNAIAEKKSKGVDVINLGIGDPDLPTPANIINALSDAAKKPENHRYPSYAGMPSFRKAAAEWYKRRFGVSMNPEDEVLALIGSKEGIAHTPLAFVNPGETVLYTNPGYPVYRISTILAGGNPVPLPLLEENDFKPDFSRVKNPKEAKLLFFGYPNNPTAATVDKDFFREVVDFALDNNVIVCHDNAYSEVTFDGYKSPSFFEVKNAKEVGIEFHSLSKTYNMTGWRIGFALGNADLIRSLGKIKENVDSGVFQAIQHAGIEAFKTPKTVLEKNLKILKGRRDLMVDGLNTLGFDVKKPKATFYLWFRIPKKFKSSVEFSKHVLNKAGVVLTPGVGFGEYGEGYVRCALTQSKERLEEALERLKKL